MKHPANICLSIIIRKILCIALYIGFTSGTRAQVYEKVMSFTDIRAREEAGVGNIGDLPVGGLLQDSEGNFYGTSSGGGTVGVSGYGTIFKVTPSGVLTNLVEFTGAVGPYRGFAPKSTLTRGSDGNFYGTTYGAFDFPHNDFPFDHGTVFKMTPSGAFTTLVEFTGDAGTKPGSLPIGRLTQHTDGSFYGTTTRGGANKAGTIFRVRPNGDFTTLVEFTGGAGLNSGRSPNSLVAGGDGAFYGTTASGGVNDLGTLFKMTHGGSLTTLVEFTGNGALNKGSDPLVSLLGPDGFLYGTTAGGGRSGLGTVFKLSPTGTLTTLIEFTGATGQNRGAYLLSS